MPVVPVTNSMSGLKMADYNPTKVQPSIQNTRIFTLPTNCTAVSVSHKIFALLTYYFLSLAANSMSE